MRVEALEPRLLLSSMQLAHRDPLARPHAVMVAIPPQSPDGVPGLANAEAHRLPDQDRSTTTATLSGAAKVDVWMLPIHRGTMAVRVDVKLSGYADPGAQAVIVVLDDARNIVGQSPLLKAGASVSLWLRPIGSSGRLTLGIVRVDTFAGAASVFGPLPISVLISVDRGAASDFPTSPDNGDPSPSDALVGMAEPARSQIALRLDLGGESPASTALDAMAGSPLGVGQDAAGGLPLRSAGPSGGVLADGTSSPAVGRLEGAVVDLSLVDLSPDLDGQVTPALGDRLAAIRSADGFPLLGMARPHEPVVASREPEAPTIPETIPERESPARGRRAGSRPLGIVAGLGAAVTISLLLPDLAVAFTPDAPRRPLPWASPKSRRRWRTLFGPGSDPLA
jgi:hypothetical protein